MRTQFATLLLFSLTVHHFAMSEDPLAISLTSPEGKNSTLPELSEKPLTMVVFLGTQCPLAKLYAPRLVELAKDFPAVGFVGVDANSQDSLVEIAAYDRRHELTFPMTKDVGSRLADALGAERTPEAFVLDKEGTILYRGRIDDQYGVGYIREAPTVHDLRKALVAATAGDRPNPAVTQTVGCYIGRRPKPTDDESVTYTGQVAGILQKHCVECHRDDQIAPFAMTDYDEVVGWSDTITEVMRDGRMPPWHANPRFGTYKNQRLMTDQEKELVYQWVANGAPRGAGEAPRLQKYATGWRLPRKPDRVFSMRDREYEIPSEGTIEYQYFVVDPKFEKETWIAASEVIPGNRTIVHHCIVFIRPPDSSDLRGFGWLAAYVPGQTPMILPPGHARRVPAGSKLVFQMHYTPTGSPQADNTEVGILLADPQKVTNEVVTLLAIDRQFEIPPGAANFQVETEMEWFPAGGRLLSLAPHMHLRGKAFRFTAERGDAQQVLLDVPNYDFNWQHVYQLTEPLELTPDMRLRCVAEYDNSVQNVVNPDPSATVRWGDQTWQEMMVGFMDVAIDKGAPLKMPWESEGEQTKLSPKQQSLTAQAFINRFDKDKDGRVQREEVPDAFSVFAFKDFDANDDDVITREEAIRQAK